MRIPAHRPSVGPEELNAISGVLESRWLGMGAATEEFEARLRELLGVKYVVGVVNCTAALNLTIEALEIGGGDEVIVPSLTYISSVQAILATGARPVFCDVREQDLTMDIEDAAARITARTRAVMPVHYGGRICDIESLRRYTGPRSIWIVEDAAHAFGSRCAAGAAGALGDAGCLSFDPIKNVTCGEGGAIATNDEDLARKLRSRRNVGATIDVYSRQKTDRPWYYEIRDTGLKNILANLNACIGLVQLKKIETFRRRRLEIIARYAGAFDPHPGLLTLDHARPGVFPFNYVVRVPGDRRDALINYLRCRGIGTAVHFIPCHRQPLFADQRVALPITEKLYPELLTLPLYVEMSDPDVDEVIGAVLEFLDHSPVPAGQSQ